MQFLLNSLYTVLVTLSIPIVLLRLLWKSRKIPGYRHRILERFGIFSKPDKVGGLWLHAVSVGESVAAIPIIKLYQQHFPNDLITVTTTTPSGSERVRATFGDQVFNVYFPYDLPGGINRFLNRIQPKICVIMETELWPNVLKVCAKRKVPVIIANGCLSLRSFQQYQKISGFIRAMLNNVTYVAAQSKLDMDRFLALGLDPNRISIAGNVKFDVKVSENLRELGLTFRDGIGNTRPVWIAASTHTGEEEQVLAAFKRIKQVRANALLMLVPRHPNRFATVLALIQHQGYSVITRSSGLEIALETDVFLGDTMGELGLFYAASDVAFVGGSMVPIGGHNILEPAALGIPVITGSQIDNIGDLSELLLKADAMAVVEDSEALANAVLQRFNHAAEAKQAGLRGQKVVEQNRGAVEQILKILIKEKH